MHDVNQEQLASSKMRGWKSKAVVPPDFSIKLRSKQDQNSTLWQIKSEIV